MRRTVRGVALLAAVLIGVAATGLPARAAPPSTEEVYDALGVDRVPGDYVVLVDVSASLEGSRYAQLRSSLTRFLAALAPDDRVTLVPFAESARAITQPAGRAPDRLVAQLPPKATGRNTDIGAAVEKGLEVLRRPDAPAQATVVLLTDGKHDPPPGSPYPFTEGYQWDRLAEQARRLPQTSLVAYAVPLAGGTGAPLLTKVFRSAQVLEPARIDRLTAALEKPKAAARAAKARELLAGHADAAVGVTWAPGPIGAGPGRQEVTLTSAARRVPLTVDSLAVTSDNPDLTVTAPAGPVTLPPGGSVTVTVGVDWAAGPRSAAPVRTVRDHATLTLTGEVGSPWAGTLTRDLGMTFRPALTGGTSERELSAQRGSLGRWIAGAVALLLLAALLWWWRGRRLSPALSGTLRVTSAAGAVRRVPLTGRRVRLTAGTCGLPGAGEVSATRARVGTTRTDLLIAYSPDGSVAGRASVTCAPGASVEVGGATFTWERDVPAPRGRPADASPAVTP